MSTESDRTRAHLLESDDPNKSTEGSWHDRATSDDPDDRATDTAPAKDSDGVFVAGSDATASEEYGEHTATAESGRSSAVPEPVVDDEPDGAQVGTTSTLPDYASTVDGADKDEYERGAAEADTERDTVAGNGSGTSAHAADTGREYSGSDPEAFGDTAETAHAATDHAATPGRSAPTALDAEDRDTGAGPDVVHSEPGDVPDDVTDNASTPGRSAPTALDADGGDTSAATAADSQNELIPALKQPVSEVTTEPLFDTSALDELRNRWRELQGSFVDSPRDAVSRADDLVAELIHQLTATYAERKDTLAAGWSEGADTEALRNALRGYRAFFNQLVSPAG